MGAADQHVICLTATDAISALAPHRKIDLHGPPDRTRQPVVDFMRRRLDAWRLKARAVRERDPLLKKQAVTAQAEAPGVPTQ